MLSLVHQLVEYPARLTPDHDALLFKDTTYTYAELWRQTQAMAAAFARLQLKAGARIAIYLPKRAEAVIAMFAANAAGCVFVPINPLLKPAQVSHILQDCGVECLITSSDRANQLQAQLDACSALRLRVLIDPVDGAEQVLSWTDLINGGDKDSNHVATTSDDQIAAILYTSGSTGKPKGVVLSHRNIVCGAKSVANYLGNTESDKLLAVLPFSFDYGLSQLTTAFFVGASVTLMDYLLPRDVIRAVDRYGITGLAAVPPLWTQLAGLEWPEQARQSLRYITNSGGAVPPALSDKLHHVLPNTDIYLMYGLTEAFRSTYLPPQELYKRPTSIGKAIPNAEVLVVRDDGSVCDDNEAGELVHLGPLVAQGYWNAPEKTAERFKPSPKQTTTHPAINEIAVWSGDKVYRDEDGYLYFVSRTDEMIKTSGYRVSPAEIEDVLYESGQIQDAVALGLPHDTLGQAIAVIVTRATPNDGEEFDLRLKRYCQQRLPNYMIPTAIVIVDELPKNPNGKYDRASLRQQYLETFSTSISDSNGTQKS